MDKDKLHGSRRDFLKASFGIAGGVILAACGNEENIEPSYTTYNQTNTPVPPATETLSATPEKIKTIDNVFKLGSFDASKPFWIVAKEPLRRFTNHTEDFTWIYAQDFPLVVRTEYPGDADPDNMFTKSIDDHHLGFYGFVFSADVDDPGETQTVLVYSHDLMENPANGDKPHTVTLGSLAFDIGGFAYNNPEKLDELYKQTVTIIYEGKEIEARISNAITLPSAVWDSYGDETLRDSKNKLGIQAIVTKRIGIPPSGPNKVRLIVASCQSEIIGFADDEDLSKNTVNISFVVLEFEKPQ